MAVGSACSGRARAGEAQQQRVCVAREGGTTVRWRWSRHVLCVLAGAAVDEWDAAREAEMKCSAAFQAPSRCFKVIWQEGGLAMRATGTSTVESVMASCWL